MASLELMAIVVEECDPAIEFFVDVLDFELIEDSPSLTDYGRPKRWVVVRPTGAETGILLARAPKELQTSVVGGQVAGRVGFFLRVDDCDTAYGRIVSAGVEFVTWPRTEPYGRSFQGHRRQPVGPTRSRLILARICHSASDSPVNHP